MSDQNTGGFKPKLGGGLSALLKADEKVQQNKVAKKESEFEFAAPETAAERIRIVFDDSGSMSGQKILDAHEGCIEFMKNCQVNQTAVAIHPMNYGTSRAYSPKAQTDLTRLTTNLPALSVLIKDIGATGGTPLFETLAEAEKTKPEATRIIVFSDGEPNQTITKDEVIISLVEKKVKCDTVLIADYSIDSLSRAYQLMKEIADRTGGIFLVFDRSKVNFKTAFKYLAPTLRLQLAASVAMQKDLQEGKLK